MTAQQVIDEAKIKLQQDGDSGFLTDAEYLEFVNEGYRDLTRYTEALERDTSTVAASWQSVISVPTDFLESRQIRWMPTRQLYVKNEREMDWDIQGWLVEVGTPDNAIYFNWDQIRLYPIPESAGTVRFRHTYIPPDLGLTDEPLLLDVFVDTLVFYVCANVTMVAKEYMNSEMFWKRYLEHRQELKRRSKQDQMTPDIFDNQRPVDVFNYPLWDQQYRNRWGMR